MTKTPQPADRPALSAIPASLCYFILSDQRSVVGASRSNVCCIQIASSNQAAGRAPRRADERGPAPVPEARSGADDDRANHHGRGGGQRHFLPVFFIEGGCAGGIARALRARIVGADKGRRRAK